MPGKISDLSWDLERGSMYAMGARAWMTTAGSQRPWWSRERKWLLEPADIGFDCPVGLMDRRGLQAVFPRQREVPRDGQAVQRFDVGDVCRDPAGMPAGLWMR